MTEKTAGAVFAAVRQEWDAWEALVAEVGPDRVTEPAFAGGWSFKDIAAHLTGWRSRTLDRLEAATRGLPDPPPPWPAAYDDDDKINTWIYERNRERPAMAVLNDASSSYARLRDAIESLPEADLFDRDRFPWLEGSSLGDAVLSGDLFGHLHEEHLPDIREWLGETSRTG